MPANQNGKAEMIKYLLLILLSTSVTAQEFDVKAFLDKTYIKIGVGYKVREFNLFVFNGDGTREPFNEPITARFELGYELTDNITIGFTHRSQYGTGMPEYYVDEFFIDYKFTFGDL